MIPQIIYIIFLIINLILIGYNHDKPKTGKHNMFTDIIVLAISIGLLYWGGFFDPLFK